MQKNDNIYLDFISSTLPRLLALYNCNPISQAMGIGDRFFWAWKLTDFGNGTFQGAVHGLARLLVNNLLPRQYSATSIKKRIDAMFKGADHLRRSNGSMEEAFPFESSFCVTALVAYDLLTAVDLLKENLSQEQKQIYLSIVYPMIRFLEKNNETHAFISNHLATACAALFKWHKLTGDGGKSKGLNLLDRILCKQSAEGWFLEYEGADPGYQSLCTYYLADVHYTCPELQLISALRRSIEFLWYFAHPDGSFGGLYGSRNTRFYFPGGLEALAAEIPEAEALADFMRKSIATHRVVTLDVMDEPNLVPLFNAYCWAATEYEKRKETHQSSIPVPCSTNETWLTEFSEAGLIIDKGSEHYTIISVHKGGLVYHFNSASSSGLINPGVVVKNGKKQYFSTQTYSKANLVSLQNRILEVKSRFSIVLRGLPNPWQFILLRLMSVTVMRTRVIREWIKQALVEYLITGNQPIPLTNTRTIVLGPSLRIIDRQEGETSLYQCVPIGGPHFVAIHMASQGYWQQQDDCL